MALGPDSHYFLVLLIMDMDDLEHAPLLATSAPGTPRRRSWVVSVAAAAVLGAALGAAAVAVGARRRAADMALLPSVRLPMPAPAGATPTVTTFAPVQTLKDISGLSYLSRGTFVAVHDMKANEEPTWPRVSFLQIPYDLVPGLQTAPISQDQINWPQDRSIKVKGKGAEVTGPNDLESAAGVPGTNYVLFCESTNSKEDEPVADRIYLAEVVLNAPGDAALNGVGRVVIKGYTTWSSFADTFNVEASAVAKLEDGRYLFFYGERDSMTIQWAEMTLEEGSGDYPVAIAIGQGGETGSGDFNLEEVDLMEQDTRPASGLTDPSVVYSETARVRLNRPIVGLDVDEVTGDIYLVSSNDLEGDPKNPPPPGVEADNGPYWSMTSIIGNVNLATGDVTISPAPTKVSHQDGFKVEAVARAQEVAPYDDVNPFQTAVPGTWIGSDDENYGGTLRKIAL